ncbi:MAG TPA: hypothetical protein VE057_11490 [Archangium sp.]|nr:hypothetical protein [Archangium sp.]
MGAQTECKVGRRNQKVTAVGCDGRKTLVTNTLSVPCAAGGVSTCVQPVAPGMVAFEHTFSLPGMGTNLSLRVWDVKKKRVRT